MNKLGKMMLAGVTCFTFTFFGTADTADAQQLYNRALEGTAGQTTTAFAISDNPNQRSRAVAAIDGNTNGSFGSGSVTHTAGGANSWCLQLTEDVPIERIDIYPRTDSGAFTRMNNTTFEIFDAAGTSVYGPINTGSWTASAKQFNVGGVVGRTVKINGSTLNIAEVQVWSQEAPTSFALGTENAALGQPAAMTSSWNVNLGADPSFHTGGALGPQNSVDGNYGNVAHGDHRRGDTVDAWQVDLGQDRNIQEVVVHAYRNRNQGETRDVVLDFFADDGASLGSANYLLTPSGSGVFTSDVLNPNGDWADCGSNNNYHYAPYKVTANLRDMPVCARYVRLDSSASTLHQGEIEVWAAPLPIADAGEDQIVDCGNVDPGENYGTVTLDASASSVGAPQTFTLDAPAMVYAGIWQDGASKVYVAGGVGTTDHDNSQVVQPIADGEILPGNNGWTVNNWGNSYAFSIDVADSGGSVTSLGPLSTVDPNSFGGTDGGGPRLNIAQAYTATLPAGTYSIDAFSFKATHSGTIKPFLAVVTGTIASGEEYETIWVGDPVDPAINAGADMQVVYMDSLTYEWFDGATSLGTGVNPMLDLTHVGPGASTVYDIDLVVTDESGCTDTDTVQVTIVDNNAPGIVGVSPDVTLECTFTGGGCVPCGGRGGRQVDRHTPFKVGNSVSATDACDALVGITVTRTNPDGNAYTATYKSDGTKVGTAADIAAIENRVRCLGLTTWDYSTTDQSGNTITASRQTTLIDTTPPVISCPADPDPIECPAPAGSTDPSVTGVATASDRCYTGDLGITYSDVFTQLPNSDPALGLGTITRTWTARDAGSDCIPGNADDNIATCDQIIQIVDSVDPTIDCPVDECLTAPVVVADAVADWVPGAAVGDTTQDVANNGWDYLASSLQNPNDPAAVLQLLTWDGVQHYLLPSSDGPWFRLQGSLFINPRTGPNTAVLRWTSDIDGAVVISGRLSNNSTEETAELRVACNGEALFSQVIPGNTTVTFDRNVVVNVGDTVDLTIDEDPGGPNGASYEFTRLTITQVGAAANATDVCDQDVCVVWMDQPDDGDECTPIVREFFAYDDSGNTDACTQQLFTDVTAPVISTTATSGDLGCNPTVTAPAFTALDNCDGALTPAVTTAGASSSDGCSYSQTWSANVSDGCGNAAAQQSITYTWKVDTTLPVITITDANPATVQCGDSYTDAGATASDNCDGDLGALVGVGSVTTTSVGSYSITYSVSDACGNPATATRTVNVVDTVAPLVTCADPTSASADENCQAAIPDAVSTAIASDSGCDDGVTVTQVPAAGTLVGLGPHTITVTATDNANNSDTCTTTFTVTDDTNPTASNPAAVEVQCSVDVPAADVTVVTDEADNCGTVTVAHVGDVSDGNTCPEVITRTYSVTDDAGNSINVTQTITVDDTIVPVIDAAPVDVTVECIDDVPVAAVLNWTDNCDAGGTVNGVDSSDGNTCPETITRTWNVSDACGNPAETRTQIITVIDTILPVITVASADTAIGCGDTFDPLAGVSATDNCDDSVTVVPSSTVDANTVGCYTVGYTATDSCGNIGTASQTVIVPYTLEGLLAPLDVQDLTILVSTAATGGELGLDCTNLKAVKAKRGGLPLKVRLTDCNGNTVTDALLGGNEPTVERVLAITDDGVVTDIHDVVDPTGQSHTDGIMRISTDKWIYTLDIDDAGTDGLGVGCYAVEFKITVPCADGSTDCVYAYAAFKLK